MKNNTIESRPRCHNMEIWYYRVAQKSKPLSRIFIRSY